jgi:hypothetical protein
VNEKMVLFLEPILETYYFNNSAFTCGTEIMIFEKKEKKEKIKKKLESRANWQLSTDSNPS